MRLRRPSPCTRAPCAATWRKEQTSFEILCNATRFDMAKELIDTALAYAPPSVFADAFRRWSGLTLTEWRRRHGHAGPA